MIRFLFNAVLVVFVLWGAVELLGAIGFLSGVPGPAEAGPVSLAALEGIGFGLVYIITAIGLYKRSPLSRGLAMVLVIFNLLGAVLDLAAKPGTINVLWLGATLLVPIVLFSAPIRLEFAAAKTKGKTA